MEAKTLQEFAQLVYMNPPNAKLGDKIVYEDKAGMFHYISLSTDAQYLSGDSGIDYGWYYWIDNSFVPEKDIINMSNIF